MRRRRRRGSFPHLCPPWDADVGCPPRRKDKRFAVVRVKIGGGGGGGGGARAPLHPPLGETKAWPVYNARNSLRPPKGGGESEEAPFPPPPPSSLCRNDRPGALLPTFLIFFAFFGHFFPTSFQNFQNATSPCPEGARERGGARGGGGGGYSNSTRLRRLESPASDVAVGALREKRRPSGKSCLRRLGGEDQPPSPPFRVGEHTARPGCATPPHPPSRSRRLRRMWTGHVHTSLIHPGLGAGQGRMRGGGG